MVYVSFPAAKDPDFTRRHPGHATVDIITAAPYEWFEPWEGSRWKHRGAEYEAFKASLADRMLEALYQQMPQLRGRVAFSEISTPLTSAHFAGYARGELYGLDHTPARFRQGFLTGHDCYLLYPSPTANNNKKAAGITPAATTTIIAASLFPAVYPTASGKPGPDHVAVTGTRMAETGQLLAGQA